MPSEPLWRTEDQQGRLTELLSEDLDQKDLPLRRDIRSLGRLLGEILKEQEGEDLFNTVETLRLLAREHRDSVQGTGAEGENPPDERDRMAKFEQIICGLSLTDAYRVTKAFSIYFELTNLAEANHRKRRL